MTPKLACPGVSTSFAPTVLGCPKLGWLNILKNSTRNSFDNRSVIFVRLMSERSTFWKPGPNNALRFMVPKRLFGINSRQFGVAGNVVLLHTVAVPLFVNHCREPSGLM